MFKIIINRNIGNYIANSIYIMHYSSMFIVYLFPMIPLTLEVTNTKYKKKRIYYSLGLITGGILFSYYKFDNICLISKYENYFSPEKYKIYKVSNDFKNVLLLSLVSLTSQYFNNTMKNKLISVGFYYSWLFYTSIKSYIKY